MSTGFNFVTLPLTTKRGGQIVVPQRSGLNWGQRPGRDPNQAYLSVPVEIQRSGFFQIEVKCLSSNVMMVSQ